MGNSVQGLDQVLHHMKRFKDRWLKYSSTQSCQGETEITLLGMRIDTILWKEPSWIYGHSWILQEDLKWRFFLALASNLTWLCNHYKYQVLMPLQPESDLELNIKDIEKFLIFPTVTHNPWYEKRSKSYEFLNISQAAVSQCWQTGATWENCMFDHRCLLIPENLQQQTCSYLLTLFSRYLYAKIR